VAATLLMAKLATFVGSCVLVALTMIVAFAVGAIRTPLCEIVPAVVDHTTAGLNAPAPFTIAWQASVAEGSVAADAHVTATEATDPDPLTVSVWLAVLVGSCTDVATILTTLELVRVAGAVYRPDARIVPVDALQVTALL